MATIYEYARIADLVYAPWPQALDGWSCPGGDWKVDDQPAGLGGAISTNGLQSRVFLRDGGNDAVIAFKGTVFAKGDTIAGKLKGTMYKDLGNDAVLSLPWTIPPQAADAMKRSEQWLSVLKSMGKVVTATGHSLGGAIAQVVGFRLDFKFTTFNAPGMWSNSHGLSISRMAHAWMTPSAELGVNYRGPGRSLVAIAGVHIGRVEVLKGAPTGHGISALADWIDKSTYRNVHPFA